MRVLDLYAGPGGFSRGVQTYLDKKGIPFEYTAVEIDPKIAAAHKINNPKSKIIVADAITFIHELKNYDFVIACPPCKSHSKLNRMRKNKPEIDTSLWFLAYHFRHININFLIENVNPYYDSFIEPTIKIGRHCFWSSFDINPFLFENYYKNFRYLSVEDLEEYHGLVAPNMSREKQRQVLRSAVHPSIAIGIFEQFLNPLTLNAGNFEESDLKA